MIRWKWGFVRTIEHYQVIPPHWGVVKIVPEQTRIMIAVVPLNWILWIIDLVWWHLRFPFTVAHHEHEREVWLNGFNEGYKEGQWKGYTRGSRELSKHGAMVTFPSKPEA